MSNEMNSLTKREQSVDPGRLDGAQYLLSLLDEAVRAGLMREARAQDLRMQTLALLPAIVDEYTCGKSSSVPEGTAQALLQSTLYTIDFYLKSMQIPAQCLEQLDITPLSEIYAQGRLLIERQLKAAHRLLMRVRQSRTETGNIAYNSTLDRGLPLFFKEYDHRFAAHETPGSIDYPLFADDTAAHGVEYILQYLKKLSAENRFCRRFSAESVRRLCFSCDSRLDEQYISLFELVLTQALGCALTNAQPDRLLLTQADMARLRRMLTAEAAGASIAQARNLVTAQAKITGRFAQGYLAASAESIGKGILSAALGGGALPFVAYAPPTEEPALAFEDGPKMPDEAFRRLTGELRECRNTADKLALIGRDFHSIEDLADMLGADCLFGREYTAFYSTLGPAGLALLCRRLPQGGGEPSLSADDTLHSPAGEIEWHRQLAAYLDGLGAERAESIRQLSKKFNTVV